MNKLTKFSIEKYLSTSKVAKKSAAAEEERYRDTLAIVKTALEKSWDSTDSEGMASRLALEKDAIIGRIDASNKIKNMIRNILTETNRLADPFPSYYGNLVGAIFADLYGLAGITPWAYDLTEEYKRSSSAKLVGDRLFCLIDGKAVLQPQRIPYARREQLKKALLLATPEEREEKGFHEVYLDNGIRVTIYSGKRCKPDEDIIVFRKYVLKDLSFEKLCSYGTFPQEAIPLFESMVEIGYNTIFCGMVRSGKTTFLQTWQSYEDPILEGVTVATDPETNWRAICPEAPIMQLVADGKELLSIEKSLKRSDADYVILEEMRDATAYNLFLGITSMGTMRSKGTIHDTHPVRIPSKMASAIRSEFGGDEDAMVSQLFTNINYVIELYQVPENKAYKRLKSITEFRYDAKTDRCSAQKICQYYPKTDTWGWKYTIGGDKEALAVGYDDAWAIFNNTLKSLAEGSPLDPTDEYYDETFPAYYKGNRYYEDSGNAAQLTPVQKEALKKLAGKCAGVEDFVQLLSKEDFTLDYTAADEEASIIEEKSCDALSEEIAEAVPKEATDANAETDADQGFIPIIDPPCDPEDIDENAPVGSLEDKANLNKILADRIKQKEDSHV